MDDFDAADDGESNSNQCVAFERCQARLRKFFPSDEFWESNNTNWCGTSCSYTVAPAMAFGTLINGIVLGVLLRRKKPMPSSELFMAAIVLNDFVHSACFLCDYFLFGAFLHSFSELSLVDCLTVL